MNTPIPIFDGHNDTLLRLTADRNPGDNFFESPHGHIDMSRARRGGLAGGFFAVYIPADPTADKVNDRDSLPASRIFAQPRPENDGQIVRNRTRITRRLQSSP